MTEKSILLFENEQDPSDFNDFLRRKSEFVTAGRYLILVTEYPKTWKSRIAYESLFIKEVMGSPEARSEEWTYFGNGHIRTYSNRTLKPCRNFQWTMVRRVGEKPYQRRKDLPSDFVEKHSLPVGHHVFTRDVANNVWNLKDRDVLNRIAMRFQSLLLWEDEEFLVFNNRKMIKAKPRRNLHLDDDLVGVAIKVPYMWEKSDTLF